MDIDYCFKERILRKVPVDLNKVNSSINVAESKLKRATALLESSFFEESILDAYTAMFHSARALLYKDGVQEKSHYAVYIYLKEKYGGEISKVLINVFYNYQKERHNILYGLDFNAGKVDAEEAVFYAGDFIISMRLILGMIKDGKL